MLWDIVAVELKSRLIGGKGEEREDRRTATAVLLSDGMHGNNHM